MVLADYGASGRVSLLYPDRGTKVGTDDWAPPEFNKRRFVNYTNRYDSWALGLLALELNIGGMPFEEDDAEKEEFQVTAATRSARHTPASRCARHTPTGQPPSGLGLHLPGGERSRAAARGACSAC
jgi:serine/threonine protein kinase